ncbi:hypothetical protein H0H93_013888 [Arthromyces matolae]|nr:hypothetical protein H0H93_013888 [Arthromyces matolae]
MKEDVGGVNGVKESMSAHLLGKGSSGKGCPNASKRARMIAQQMKGSGSGQSKRSHDSVDTEEFDHQQKRAKTKVLTNVEESFMKQTKLKVFRGPALPFSAEQQEIVRQQFLRATISANLPYQWVENPEVIALFSAIRTGARPGYSFAFDVR